MPGILSQIIIEKISSKIVGYLVDSLFSVFDNKQKRKLNNIIESSMDETFLIMENESPRRENTDYKKLLISYIEQIGQTENKVFAKVILEYNASSSRDLLKEIGLNDKYDEDLIWCSKCITMFCLKLTYNILNEAMNHESPLYNMVQILNIDIVKSRIDSILQNEILLKKRIDEIYNLVDYKKYLDFDMNQGISGQVLNITPPSVVIKNFLDSYISHDNVIISYGGREDYTKQLNDWLNDTNKSNYALLTAEAGRGKSALMAHWYSSIINLNGWNVIFIPISIRAKFNGQDNIYPFLLNQLVKIFNDNHNENDNLTDIIDLSQPTQYNQERISKLLKYFASNQIKTLIIFDGLDEAFHTDLEIKGFFDLLKGNGIIYESVKIICTARYINHITSDEEWAEEIGFVDYYKMPQLQLLSKKSIANILINTKDPLNKLVDKELIIKELHRLSSGEPLLIKLYIDELLKEKNENLTKLTPEILNTIDPGYKGYLDYYIKGHDFGIRLLRQTTCILCILAYAKMPLNEEDINVLYNMSIENDTNFKEAFSIIDRLLYNQGGNYSFCHQAIAIYLTKCEVLGRQLFCRQFAKLHLPIYPYSMI